MNLSNSNSLEVRPENALNRRIRQMVRMLINADKICMQKPVISRLRHASWQEWLKLIIGLFCSCIFLYQAYERIIFYLSEPVVVEVSIVKQEHFTFPAITVCFTDFGQLTNLLLAPAQRNKLVSCEDETNATGQQVLNMSNINFWKGRTDVNVTWIAAQLQADVPVELKRVVILPQGVCTTFYADTPVKFQGSKLALNFDLIPLRYKCGPYFPRMFCAHLYGEEPHHKEFLGILGFRGADFGMSVTTYKFLDRQKHRCSGIKTYWNCIEKCLLDLWPQLLPCRSHYLTPELTNLPLCNSRKRFQTALVRSFRKMAELDPDKTCNCIQPCERTIFKTNYRPRPTSEKIQRLSLFFEDNFITSFEECYAYGFIALLCDVGGIMGLYLGWSLLKLFCLIQILYPQSEKSKEKHNLWIVDPIYLKVRKHYEKMKRGNIMYFYKLLGTPSNPTAPPPMLGRLKSVRYVLLFLCVTCCIYVSYNRISLYISTPVITIVDVKPQTRVQFPIFTYCKDNKAIIKYKQQIADAQNLRSLCEVDFLQLLEIPGINITKLWEISNSEVNILENQKKKINILCSIIIYFCVIASLMLGIPGKRVHMGRNMFEELKILPQCGDSVKVYITPPGSKFDFSHYYIVSNTMFYPRLEFKMQERHVSAALKNCISTDEAEKCKELCINKRLMKKLKCRLPLFPKECKELHLCTSYKEAKETSEIYVDILTTTDGTNDYNCPRQCLKYMFQSDIFLIPGKPRNYPNISTRVGYRETDKQIFTEIPSYTATKLFCDIGGILGLLLGFSFLEFIDILIRKGSLKINSLFQNWCKILPLDHKS